MGVCIKVNLDINKTTNEEWENVFYNVGKFIEKTPLVELTTYNVLEQDVYIYDNCKIRDDKYIKIDADSDTYRGAETFKLYKNLDLYKVGNNNEKVSIWNRKTQKCSYHKYVLAAALVLEYFLPNKIEICGDISNEEINESKNIVKNLYDITIIETSATNNIESSSSTMEFLMNLFRVIENDIDYDVFKDEYDMVKRLELISKYDLDKKGIDIDKISLEELKIKIFKTSKEGSYIWNLNTINKIVECNDLELLRKYYILLSLNLRSGDVFDECEIKFFPDNQIKDLRKPKMLIDKFVTAF